MLQAEDFGKLREEDPVKPQDAPEEEEAAGEEAGPVAEPTPVLPITLASTGLNRGSWRLQSFPAHPTLCLARKGALSPPQLVATTPLAATPPPPHNLTRVVIFEWPRTIHTLPTLSPTTSTLLNPMSIAHTPLTAKLWQQHADFCLHPSVTMPT